MGEGRRGGGDYIILWRRNVFALLPDAVAVSRQTVTRSAVRPSCAKMTSIDGNPLTVKNIVLEHLVFIPSYEGRAVIRTFGVQLHFCFGSVPTSGFSRQYSGTAKATEMSGRRTLSLPIGTSCYGNVEPDSRTRVQAAPRRGLDEVTKASRTNQSAIPVKWNSNKRKRKLERDLTSEQKNK